MEKINGLGLTIPKDSSFVKKGSGSANEGEFSKMLKNSINELNQVQETSDKALADMASGNLKDLHQAAIAIGKAETSMKLMLEVRNKALSAYKEILRTQV